MGYAFWLSAEASQTLLGCDRRTRQKIEQMLIRLSSSPFATADFQENSPAGRTYDVRCIDDIIVTYWVDHAVKEVRILRLEIV